MTAGGATTTACRIALDAMGGDHAPREIVAGALLATKEYGVEILLVGREEVVKSELAALGEPAPRGIEIVDAREVVEMTDSPLTPIRKKRNSSIRVCANLVAERRADAFVSAGNTGAAWTSARMVMGMIEGVERPALAAILPSQKGHTLLLDVGANVDAKSSHLREFAVMGHFYAQMLFDNQEPRVGLLSIGEEDAKGNSLTKESRKLMRDEPQINFIGNVEGRDMFTGQADVIVCDGFTGNIALKTSEGVFEFIMRLLKHELKATIQTKAGALLTRPAFQKFKKRLDYAEYGGAPLLGIKGVTVICHGRSNAKAIRNAIRVARDYCEGDVNSKIESSLGAVVMASLDGHR